MVRELTSVNVGSVCTSRKNDRLARSPGGLAPHPPCARNRSASSAAMHPVPAADTACR